MNAIDTNIVVRYVTGDGFEQTSKARSLVDAEAVFVSTTVLLETEWVLRSVFRYPAPRVAEAIAAFAGLPTVSLQDPPRIVAALNAMAAGLDFADALHLAAAEDCDTFFTFDRGLAKAAAGLAGVTVRTP